MVYLKKKALFLIGAQNMPQLLLKHPAVSCLI